MKRRWVGGVFICLLFYLTTNICPPLQAQTDTVAAAHRNDNHELWREVIASKVGNGELSIEESEELVEKMEALIEQPIDLNQALESDLKQIPFLTDFQIRQFILFIHQRPEGLNAIWDLKLIPSWEPYTIDLIRPFIKVEKRVAGKGLIESIRNARGKTTFQLGTKLPMEESRKTDDYAGNNNGIRFKLSHKKSKFLSIGLAGDLDAGESFNMSRYGGFDHYSAHLMLSDLGPIRKFVLGDYRLSLGYGLVANQGFGYRFISDSPEQIGRGLSQTLTMSEGGFQRGIATTLGTRYISATLAASCVWLDANVETQMDGKKLIHSIHTTGLHRSQKELSQRHNLPMRNLLANLHYGDQQLQAGFITSYYDWKQAVIQRPPGRESAEGITSFDRFINASIYYQYNSPNGRTTLYGELAGTHRGALAFLQGISHTTNRNARYTAIVRYLSENYWAYYGKSQTHFSSLGNEKGLYLSISEELMNAKVSLSTDLYQSLRPRYKKSHTSKGYRISISVLPLAMSTFRPTLRAVWQHEQNSRQRFYLTSSLIYQPNGANWSTCIDARYLYRSQHESHHGYAMGIRGEYNPPTLPIRTSVGGILFRSDTGLDRMFFVERQPNLFHNFSFVYGHGRRIFFWGEWQINSLLKLQMKVEHNHFSKPIGREQTLLLASISYGMKS